jgi:hypothetical protein
MIVNYKMSNVLNATANDGTEFLFVPGNNEITSTLWNNLLAMPNFKRRVDEGMFKISSKDDKSSVVILSELSPSEAKELVSETFDPKLLREWQTTETRPGVIKAIDARLKEADDRLTRKPDGK